MNGKKKCKILKEIRAQIAQANDISLVVNECTHKGECRGTCPRCEAEVRYLEQELEKRRQLGKRIALAGVSVGVTVALSGCSVLEDMAWSVREMFRGRDDGDIIDVMGDVPMYDPTELPEGFLMGEVEALPPDFEG